MKKLNEAIGKMEESLLVLGMLFMGIIMSFQVTSRSVFGQSIVWSEELTRHIFIWTTFIGMSYGVKKLTHVNLNYFIDKIPAGFRHKIFKVVDVILIIAFMLLFYYGIVYSKDQMGISAPTMGYPMGYVMMAMPVSSVLCIIGIASRLFVRQNAEGIEENRS